MGKFRRDLSGAVCTDRGINQRTLALDAHEPGCVYAYLIAEEVLAAADQFEDYGVRDPDDPLASGIDAVVFQHDLRALVEAMIRDGLDQPQDELRNWLLIFQQCARRLAEALEAHTSEGPPPTLVPRG